MTRKAVSFSPRMLRAAGSRSSRTHRATVSAIR